MAGDEVARAAALRILEAATWQEAVAAMADPAVRSEATERALMDAAADAAAAGDDQRAASMRRHTSVVKEARTAGTDAALRMAAKRIDPHEPKDRLAWHTVIGRAAFEPLGDLPDLVGTYPELLSAHTDDLLADLQAVALESDALPNALRYQFLRLLLRRCRRVGTVAAVASISPPGEPAAQVAQLTRAVERGAWVLADDDLAAYDELLEIRLALFWLHTQFEGEAGALEASLAAAATAQVGRFRLNGDQADLRLAIETYIAVMALLAGDGAEPPDPSHPQVLVGVMGQLARALLMWEEHTGDASRRQLAISLYREHLKFVPSAHPLRLASVADLAGLLLAEFRTGASDPDVLDQAATMLSEVLAGTGGDELSHRLVCLTHLAHVELLRFECSGDPEAAYAAVDEAAAVAATLPTADPERRRLAAALARTVAAVAQSTRDAGLMDGAVRAFELAADPVGLGVPDTALLTDLAQALLLRYELRGVAADLESALSAAQRAVVAARSNAVLAAQAQNMRGMILKSRFQRSGRIGDINDAVTAFEEAARTLHGLPAGLGATSNWGASLLDRYQHGGTADDLHAAFGILSHLRTITSTDDPAWPSRVNAAALASRLRYRLGGQRSDLDAAIAMLGEATSAPPSPLTDLPGLLSNLAYCLRERFIADDDPADLEQATALMRTAVERTPPTAPSLEILLNGYLQTLVAGPVRERRRAGLPDADLMAWPSRTVERLLTQCRLTGDVAGGLATISPPSSVTTAEAPLAAAQPSVAEPDPDGFDDDRAPQTFARIRLRQMPPIQAPEGILLHVRRAMAAGRLVAEHGNEADRRELLTTWMTVLHHPTFDTVAPGSRRALILLATAAHFAAYNDTKAIGTLDGLLDCYTRILALTELPAERAVVALDFAHGLLWRFAHTSDVADLDRAFDTLAAAIAGLPLADRLWRRTLRYLFTVFQTYPKTASFPVARRRRVAQLDRWLAALGAAGTTNVWLHARKELLLAYAALTTDPNEAQHAFRRSVEIAAAGADAARRAGDARFIGLFTDTEQSAAEHLAAAEARPGPDEVTLADIMAEPDPLDPAAARLRLEQLRVATGQVDPVENYAGWWTVQLSLVVALAEDRSAQRAEHQDEAITVAEAVAREAGRRGDAEVQFTVLMLLGELLDHRLHGTRSDNLDRAVHYAEQAVDSTTPGSRAWARSKAQLGFLLSQRSIDGRVTVGDAERALAECREAIASLSPQQEPEAWALSHFLLGNVHLRRAISGHPQSFEDAIAAYHVALDYELLEDRRWANVHHQLGDAYRNRMREGREDNLRIAISHHEAELTVFTKERTPDDWALAQLSLGETYSKAYGNDPAETAARAVDAFGQALEVVTRERDPRMWAQIQISLGLLAVDGDNVGDRPVDPERAVGHFTDALGVYDPQLSPREWARTHGFIAGAEVQLARAHLTDPATAIEHLDRAVHSATLALAGYDDEPYAIDRARMQTVLAGATQARAELDPLRREELLTQSARVLESAQAVFVAMGAVQEVRGCAINLAMIYDALGWWPQCVAAYETGIAAAEAGYAESLSQAARAVELDQGLRLVRLGVHALVKVNRFVDALVALEGGRGRWLGESMARDQADLRRLTAEHRDLAEQFQTALAKVQRAEALERRSDFGAGTALLENTRHARTELTDRIRRIRRIDGYERFLDLPDRSDIVRVVQVGRPLIYLLPVDDGCLILAASSTRPGGLDVQCAHAPGLNRWQLDSMLFGGVDPYLPAAHASTPDAFRPVLDVTLAELGALLMGDVAALVRASRAHAVTLIAGGRLGVLPLHAAPYDHDGRRLCLLDEVPVSYAPSAWVLTHSRDTSSEPVLVGVGDPTGDLRYAGTELADIAEVFPRPEPDRLLLGAAATRKRLLERLPGATHVHLACHGFYDISSPMDSHLALADDDRLTLRELLDEHMLTDARLVVASACQTAVSDFMRMPDEAIGLPAGFMHAGADAVIGTLWPVGDLPTALLMQRFYQCHLKGDPDADSPTPMPMAEALRMAQQWLAGMGTDQLTAYFTGESVPATEANSHRPFAHAYFWAGFVLAGR